jgi:GNAT superfamily N-acetyltransferase
MFALRDFDVADCAQVDALGVAAFEQYRDDYADWPVFRARIANMSALAASGEIIVASREGCIIGAVAYIGPGQPKPAFFQPDWPIMRMLVVAPEARGLGVGRALAQECIRRARRDGAGVFALHTSELMQVALPMYQRMGFQRWSDAPDIHGVKYGVYLKRLDAPPAPQTFTNPA